MVKLDIADVKNHFKAAMDVDYLRVNQDLVNKRIAVLEAAAASQPAPVKAAPAAKK